MNTLAASRLRLIVTAALFSTGGAAIKAIDLSPWQVASFRSGIAAVALLILIPASRRLNHLGVWLVGSSFAATMILFVLANKLTTAANTIFLQSTAPVYMILLAPWLLKEPVRRRDAGFLLPMLFGMSLFFLGQQTPEASAPDPWLGNLLATISGLTWATTILGLRLLSKGGQSGLAAGAVSAGSLISCAAALPMALPVAGISVNDISLLLFLGIFQIGLAYALLSRGMVDVPGLEASLLLLLEPVLNPVWAFLFQGELPNLWSGTGCFVILSTVIVRAVVEARGH